MSYSMALFWLKRKLRRLGNLLVLSTVLLSALTSLAHSFLISGGSFLSIMLTELVVVISLSNPSFFRSLYPSSTASTSSMNFLFSPSLMGLTFCKNFECTASCESPRFQILHMVYFVQNVQKYRRYKEFEIYVEISTGTTISQEMLKETVNKNNIHVPVGVSQVSQLVVMILLINHCYVISLVVIISRMNFVLYRNNLEVKNLVSQHPEFNILANFINLVSQKPELKILAKFKILVSQNPEFKFLDSQIAEFNILADFEILASQYP